MRRKSKRIYLWTRYGLSEEYALVSEEVFERVNQYTWYRHKRGYAQANLFESYPLMYAGEKQTVLMHRFIMDVWDDEKKIVHHRDHIKLHNQR